MGWFAVIVVIQHVLEPRLSPARHTVSEYANGRAGGLMTAGFLAWATSLTALGVAMRAQTANVRRSRASATTAAFLFIAALAAIGTGAYRTQTIAGVLPPGVERSPAGRLHDLFSGGLMLALVGASLASIVVAPRGSRFRRYTALLIIVAGLSAAVLLGIGDAVGGVRQRLLLLTGCAWQALLIRHIVSENLLAGGPRRVPTP